MECFRCDLCNKTANELIALSCNHKTCKDCFYKICIFNKKMIEAFTYETDKELDLQCMICSSGSLKIHKRNIIKKLNRKRANNVYEKICPLHQKGINIYCIDCRISMCAECFLSHKALPMFTSHQQGDTPMNNGSFIQNTCFIHDNAPYHYFCTECELPLCELCKSDHVLGHKIRSIQEFFNEKKDEFKLQFQLPECSLEEISERIDESGIDLKQIINTQVSNLKDKINSIIDYLYVIHTQLDKEIEIIYEEIDVNNTINKTLFNHLIRDLENVIKSPEFDYNCRYISKINKNNKLVQKELKSLEITEALNDMKNLIFRHQANLNNKNLFQITDKTNEMCSTHTLTGHSWEVLVLYQLKDGSIVSGSADNTIKIWNPEENFNCAQTLFGHSSAVYSILELQDGKIASGSQDKTIKIWNPKEDFNCIFTFKGHSDAVISLIQLRDGRMVSSSWESKINVWNPRDSFKCLQSLTEHSSTVYTLLELHDGRMASGSGDKTIKIWNPKDNFKCIYTLTGHTKCVKSLIELGDGLMASASDDNNIKLWNIKNLQCTHTLTGHTDAVISLTRLNNSRFASGSTDLTIKIWDQIDSYDCICTLTGHSRLINSLIKIDDDKMASCSFDNTIRIWQ